MNRYQDYMVRATAAQSQIRIFAASTKNMVEEMRSIHNTSPVVTAALGRLLTGGVMMGAMLKGEKDMLTLQVRGDGPLGGMTVTADSQGNAKGYAYHPQVILPPNKEGKLDVGGAVGQGSLSVIKDMGLKEPYVGQTVLQTGEIAEDLTWYFASSEQIPSSVGLGVLMERDNTVKQAGGFIIQLMPFAEDTLIEKIEENLKKFGSVTAVLDEGKTPEEILKLLMGGLDIQIGEQIELHYTCNCSKERVEKAIISIGQKEIQEMIADGEPIHVDCHFCSKDYTFSIEELEVMLKKAR
ncbi:MAG: Hsp33 family molecular chaperone HslO [Lachnospiraceae bacterium]|nr:Hsp33 family molecular chaperone HslO [Lachnospiraceae bacterium]